MDEYSHCRWRLAGRPPTDADQGGSRNGGSWEGGVRGGGLVGGNGDLVEEGHVGQYVLRFDGKRIPLREGLQMLFHVLRIHTESCSGITDMRKYVRTIKNRQRGESEFTVLKKVVRCRQSHVMGTKKDAHCCPAVLELKKLSVLPQQVALGQPRSRGDGGKQPIDTKLVKPSEKKEAKTLTSKCKSRYIVTGKGESFQEFLLVQPLNLLDGDKCTRHHRQSGC